MAAPTKMVIFHFFIGVCSYIGKERELSFRVTMRPWICVAFSALVAAASVVFIVYPIGQGSFLDGMPLSISGTFNFMLVFQAEYNYINAPVSHVRGCRSFWWIVIFSDARIISDIVVNF